MYLETIFLMASRNNYFDVQTDILQRDQVLFVFQKKKVQRVSLMSVTKSLKLEKKKLVKKRKQQQKLPASGNERS